MPQNSLSPGFIKIFSTGQSGIHVQTLSYNPDILGTGGLTTKSGSILTATAGVAALVGIAKAVVTSAYSFDYWERWSQATPTADPIFQETGILGIAGTSAGTAQPAHGLSFNFRTNAGGNGKLIMLDSTAVLQGRLRAPTYGGTAVLGIVNYLIGNTNWVTGRDNSYPIAIPSVTGKFYDALRKRFYLDA